MHDIIATRMDIAGDHGLSPQTSAGDHEVAKAVDSRVDRSLDGVRRPPFGWRGPWRSWLPGAWGDPL